MVDHGGLSVGWVVINGMVPINKGGLGRSHALPTPYPGVVT